MITFIGFMQGRLCDPVGGMIQAFPWDEWESEFSTAESIGLHNMEWTLDQERLYENPLMTEEGRARIISLSTQHELSIPSLTGDCFMQAPFWKADGHVKTQLQRDFISVCRACSDVGINIVVVPLVDNGALETIEQENDLVDFLLREHISLEKNKTKIVFESDYTAAELQRFIERLPQDTFGINYDMGNSAALGFSAIEELSAYGSRVFNVHVKDRPLGGTTVPLGTGSTHFDIVFAELSKAGYAGNFILQTARASNNDHVGVLSHYRDMTLDWIHRHM